jgi:carbon monoxide dehydrogenase subunit G
MGTIRQHVRIDRHADEVWKAVSDWESVSKWFPMIVESSIRDDGLRNCVLTNGAALQERLVTSDDKMRRFQYTIVSGDVPIESHFATIDVLEDGDGALVIYSVDLDPDEIAEAFAPGVRDAVDGLKEHLDG